MTTISITFNILILFIFLSISQAQPFQTPTPCPLILPTPYDPPKSPSTITPRVIGGLRTPPIPYMASLFKSGFFRCSATVISPTVVLAAAHCLPSDNKSAYEYFVRVSASSTQQGSKIRVASFQLHPSYNRIEQFDIAAIFLLHPIPNSNFPKLATDPQLPRLWSYIRIMGFGTHELGKPTDGALRRADSITSPCSWVRPSDIGETSFNYTNLGCAGGITVSNCTGCYGDTGGPWLQYDTDGLPVLVGITSISSLCGRTDSVTVFVRLASVVPWLRQIGADFTPADKLIKNVFVDVTPSPRPSSSPTPTPFR